MELRGNLDRERWRETKLKIMVFPILESISSYDNNYSLAVSGDEKKHKPPTKMYNSSSRKSEEFSRSKDAEIKKALNTNLNLLNENEFNLLYNKLAESNLSLDGRNGNLKFGSLIKAADLIKGKGQGNNHKNGNVSRKNWRFSYHGQDVSIGTNYGHVEFENSVDISAGKLYSCLTCKKKYRWKSTLRRHEMVECGGKEPSFQCPQCPYRAKQRGNLGVHMRKYHSNV
ncbi:hypothetical protein RUM44_002913 [Polyplax serrata]|uniref:C2H2-type domain-containing protein n=1 Tax=Polyplax serrata TaxID=468196 RepID=A0ABR1AYJ4_POLSC